MIHLHVRYACASKSNRDAFYNAIKDLGAICKSETGNIQYDYFFPAEKEDELFLWEIWESPETLDAHTKTAHFIKIGEMKTKYNVTTNIERLDI